MKGAITAVLLLAAAIITGCNSAVSTDSAMVKVKLGPYVFHISDQNYMEGKRPFWVDWISGVRSGAR